MCRRTVSNWRIASFYRRDSAKAPTEQQPRTAAATHTSAEQVRSRLSVRNAKRVSAGPSGLSAKNWFSAKKKRRLELLFSRPPVAIGKIKRNRVALPSGYIHRRPSHCFEQYCSQISFIVLEKARDYNYDDHYADDVEDVHLVCSSWNPA
jgi:hypothetical protein